MSELRRIDISTIRRTAQTLHLQSRHVVEHMLDWIRTTSGPDGKISWEEFRSLLVTIMPNNLEGQITLFLKAYVPKSVPQAEIDNYKFT